MLFNRHKYGKLRNIPFDLTTFREFTSVNEAECWGHSLSDSWAEKYLSLYPASMVHNDPVGIYLGEAHREINRYKRGLISSISPSYYEIAYKTLPDVIETSNPLEENIIVYRLLTGNIATFYKLENNCVVPFHEMSFLSTGLLLNQLYKSVTTLGEDTDDNSRLLIFKIYVPKGEKGIYANSIVTRGEYEFLINHEYYLHPVSYPKEIPCQCYKYNSGIIIEWLLSKKAVL